MIITVDSRAEPAHVLVTWPGSDLDLVIAGELRARVGASDPADLASVVVVLHADPEVARRCPRCAGASRDG